MKSRPRRRRSPLAGFSRDPKSGKFRARFRDARGELKSIGSFSTQEDAALAYNTAVSKLPALGRRKLNKVDSAGRLLEKPGV